MSSRVPPTVSVVIPTYNQPDLLDEALRSVFAQTFRDFEVVVVDDGSTDDTPRRLRAWGDRVRVVRQPNGGVGAARNRGIDEARGRYVALLDHDDLWLPGKLAAQVEFMRRHPACCGVSVPYAFSTSPAVAHFDAGEVAGPDGIVQRPVREWIDGRPVAITSSVVLFDRERAAGLRYGTQRGAVEDVEFLFGLFARGPFGIAGDGVLAIYRIHPSNVSGEAEYFGAGLRYLRALEARGGLATGPAVTPEERRAFLDHLGRVAAMRYLHAGQRGRGLATYLREAPHQLRSRRLRFLAAYPVLLLAPTRVARQMERRS
ncbi:MAG TPA: glycosyltransferase family 2 protein [Longimicrobium sp.]|uniref:glycosyltransferase family 2 protein n=1 Tax=Longimicrobium sp. TaxID=2029185 RepID=UPI002ED96038